MKSNHIIIVALMLISSVFIYQHIAHKRGQEKMAILAKKEHERLIAEEKRREQKRIERLRQEDKRDWMEASRINTISVYLSYQKSHPLGI